ncbi:DUF4190 domain-containing protein [Microbacterium sp. XT11]|uniref:DUF4190 domain-containing protein n=1 Tax=Microbacterium sp. XT11 TaxID=367477 RepID=UPI000742DAEC|nr:DUF4190 domain-containing protein [Microbacterium sp. XT11]ALX66449.1 hypothetical protein AB663_001632 [Microbacterium sp. XT11]
MTNPDQQPPQPPQQPAWNTTPDATPAPQYAPPAQPGAAAAYGAPAEPVPGRGLAIAGFILAIVAPLVGLILSIVARVKLKKAGAPTGLATAGIVIGAILTVFWIIVGVVAILGIVALASMCAELGSGVWEVNGVTYTCG